MRDELVIEAMKGRYKRRETTWSKAMIKARIVAKSRNSDRRAHKKQVQTRRPNGTRISMMKEKTITMMEAPEKMLIQLDLNLPQVSKEIKGIIFKYRPTEADLSVC